MIGDYALDGNMRRLGQSQIVCSSCAHEYNSDLRTKLLTREELNEIDCQIDSFDFLELCNQESSIPGYERIVSMNVSVS